MSALLGGAAAAAIAVSSWIRTQMPRE